MSGATTYRDESRHWPVSLQCKRSYHEDCWDRSQRRFSSQAGWDDPSNGILLRSDLHRLFDAGLLLLSGNDAAEIDNDIQEPAYRQLDGRITGTGTELRNLSYPILVRP
jgi:hypothetical protein